MPEDADAAPSLWLVDGFNVLHGVLLGGRDRSGWWTAERRAELVDRAERFDEPGARVVIAFDGARDDPSLSRPDDRVKIVFAPSADAWLLDRVKAAQSGDRVNLVTRDRALAERARRRGARVVAPAEFLARCPE